MAKTLAETAAALGPKSMEIDNEKIEQRSVDDLKKARDDEENQEAGKTPPWGLRITRLVPPSTG